MKKSLLLLCLCTALAAVSWTVYAVDTAGTELQALLSPDMPLESVPKDLKLPDAVLPFLKTMFSDSIGKQGSFDMQSKIVMMANMVTNKTAKRYDFLNEVVMWNVKGFLKTEQKITSISPDARVLAISIMAESSNSNYVTTMLAVVERDEDVNPRVAAAKIMPALGNADLIVPKLVDLLRNQYGASRAKFTEQDTKRWNDDKVALAICQTLGEVGDPRAFPVLLQTVMNPDMHRDDTIKAAWEAIKKIKW
jgi:hypothetical protein